MLVISSREFREKQIEYFDRADQGEQIIVQRGKDKAYVLTPVSKNDMYFNAEMIALIEERLQEIKNGEVVKVSSPEQIAELLGV